MMELEERRLWLIILSLWVVPPIAFLPLREIEIFILWIPAIMFTFIWGFLYFSMKSYDEEHNKLLKENEDYYNKMQNLGKG